MSEIFSSAEAVQYVLNDSEHISEEPQDSGSLLSDVRL